MNDTEITAEILKEYAKLRETTMPRLAEKYDRERRKLGIDKRNNYPRDYAVKTAGKNTWIIFLKKAIQEEKYKDVYSVTGICIVYYYSKQGLRIFAVDKQQNIVVYNGHFFKRYNERLGLNILHSLDVVKLYFNKDSFSCKKIIERNNREFLFAVSAEGLSLGEIMHGGKWTVYKTFISRNLLRPDQDEEENQLIATMQGHLDLVIMLDLSEEDHFLVTAAINSLKKAG